MMESTEQHLAPMESGEHRAISKVRKRKRFRRRLRYALAGAAILWLGLVAALALGVRGDLDAARSALERASARVLAGDIEAAEPLVARALTLAGRAERRSLLRPMRAGGLIPIVGRSLRATSHLSRMVRLAAEAGVEALGAVGEFPTRQGELAYRPVKGRLDLAPWHRAVPALERMQALIDRAVAEADLIPSAWLIGPVARAREQALVKIDELNHLSDRLVASARVIPKVLGAVGPRRYLIVFQNPAELRPTGGLVGGFALIEANRGRISLKEVASNIQLEEPVSPVPMPAWFAARYDPWRTRQQWNQSNFEPDFRFTGRLFAGMFESTTGVSVDGVIAADPIGVAELLQATGPVNGPGGVVASAKTFARLVMIDGYTRFPDESLSEQRKQLFVGLAAKVWQRALSSTDFQATGRALARAAGGRHVLMWARDTAVQRAYELLGIAGVFRGPAGLPFVGLVTTNLAPNKVDAYLRRSVELDIEIKPDGGASVQMRATLRNGVPLDRPPFVLGPSRFSADLDPGESALGTEIYLPMSSAAGFRRDAGGRTEYFTGSPPDVFASRPIVVRTKSGKTQEVRATWTYPRLVDSQGRMSLTVLKQPTAHADALRIRIRLPRDMGFAPNMEGFRRERGVWVWQGKQEGDVTFEARIHRTAWGRIKDLLGKRIL